MTFVDYWFKPPNLFESVAAWGAGLLGWSIGWSATSSVLVAFTLCMTLALIAYYGCYLIYQRHERRHPTLSPRDTRQDRDDTATAQMTFLDYSFKPSNFFEWVALWGADTLGWSIGQISGWTFTVSMALGTALALVAYYGCYLIYRRRQRRKMKVGSGDTRQDRDDALRSSRT